MEVLGPQFRMLSKDKSPFQQIPEFPDVAEKGV